MTAVATSVYTAAIWNTYIKDNLNASGIGVMTSGAGRHLAVTGAGGIAERTANTVTVSTSQSTTSTTYVDLATAGPAAGVTTGVKAFVMFGAEVYNNTGGLGSRVAVAVSGATTSAASDTNSFLAESGTSSDVFKGTWATIYDPITAGSSTFTLKYRAVGGGTSTFANRNVAIIPF